ncbi:MAG: hypothetical protein LUE99_18260 [Bacteroides sp.]|nr:hypothetical protein [Bacteroides sp.]
MLEKFKRVARIVKVPKIKADYWNNLKICYEDSFTNSDLLCLLSYKFAPELEKLHLSNFDRNKVIAIGNPNTYPPQEPSSKKKQILYVGRIEWYQKRVDRLVYIWKHLYKRFLIGN